MKVKATTLVLILAALGLGGYVYFNELQSPANNSLQQGSGQPVFTFKEDDVQTLRLETPLRTLSFKRDNAGQWQMVEPDAGPANQATVAYLLNLLVTSQSDRTLTVPTSNREQFGLHQPLAQVEVQLTDDSSHQLTLGTYDFNRSFLYAQADPSAEAENIQLLLLSPDFENAVSRPLSDWQQPAEEAPPTDIPLDAPPEASPKPDEAAP